MPKKKSVKSTKAPAKPSQKDLFSAHPHLKWLLPIFAVVALGFAVLVYKSDNMDDTKYDKSHVIKEEVKSKLMNDNDNKTDDDMTSPVPTVSY